MRMPALAAHDGTKLAYHLVGAGTPVVCLGGGPMQDSAYLGDLGGLSEQVSLIRFDYRGTGESATPAERASYRCDRLVDDVEALREHLDLDRVTLLAHCAGANVAALYLARHRERVAKLALITPSTMAVGISATGDDRRELVRRRKDEPWFPSAWKAFDAIQAGHATDADWEAIAPFTYGRWDEVARAHHAREEAQRNAEAAAVFAADGAFDPPATRAALAAYGAPVLVLAGELDVAAPPRVMDEYAGLFPTATLVVQPGAGHFPWLDDRERFTTTLARFLR